MDFFDKRHNGIRIRNDSGIPLLVIASQLTPLYWGRVDPGQTWNVNNERGMGRVWFTISVSVYDEAHEPTKAGVALRLTAITAAAVIPATALLFTVGAIASGLTSVRGVSKTGVYADGKTLIAYGKPTGDGTFNLCIADESEHFAGQAHVQAQAPVSAAPQQIPYGHLQQMQGPTGMAPMTSTPSGPPNMFPSFGTSTGGFTAM